MSPGYERFDEGGGPYDLQPRVGYVSLGVELVLAVDAAGDLARPDSLNDGGHTRSNSSQTVSSNNVGCSIRCGMAVLLLEVAGEWTAPSPGLVPPPPSPTGRGKNIFIPHYLLLGPGERGWG